MSKLTEDVRVDTLTIGLLNALAWYLAYPLFVNFLSIVDYLGDVVKTPFLALASIAALPMLLLFLGLSLVPAAFSSLVTYSVAFVVRNAYHYRLQNSSWRSLIGLAAVYSTISLAVFAIGIMFLPPNLTDQEQKLHQWLWPSGVVILSIMLSVISAWITCRLLRPSAHENA
jgi:hypothetical protein